jgi:hypothetical protein
MIAFLVLSICLYVSILCSSIASVMVVPAQAVVDDAEEPSVASDPAPPSVASDPEMMPTPSVASDPAPSVEPVPFEVEEEPALKKETFKLIRDVDYFTADLYHHDPGEKEKCLADCSSNPSCKAVVFDGSMSKCWGKSMAEFEMPLHQPNADRLTYVKKDSYEEAIKKYG